MPVAINGKYAPLDASQIIRLETELGLRFPDEYRHFLERYNVGVPERNEFTDGKFSTAVSIFFGVGDKSYEDLRSKANSYAGRLPSNCLAIASAEGGNLICLRLPDGDVFYWDHEQEAGEGEEVSYSNMRRLSPSLDEFLDDLMPPGPSSLAADPDAVVIKTKPDFREKFKKYM